MAGRKNEGKHDGHAAAARGMYKEKMGMLFMGHAGTLFFLVLTHAARSTRDFASKPEENTLFFLFEYQ